MTAFDHALFMYINAEPTTPVMVVAAARWISGSLPMWLACLGVLGMVFSPPRIRLALGWTLLGMLLASLVAYLIRQHWPAPRPAQLGLGIQWIHHTGRASFPSMHATIAFAMAVGLTLAPAMRQVPWGRVAIAFTWLCALAIGWSRLSLGVHFPSDVMGGALLGAGSATLMALLAERLAPPAMQWTMRLIARGRSSSYWSRRALP